MYLVKESCHPFPATEIPILNGVNALTEIVVA